jgi:transcriptional regulator with XRE-family HTH domain
MSSTFGSTIQCLRKQCGLTQAQLARRLGVSRRTIGFWERDWTRPHPRRIGPLAEALGCSVSELVNGVQWRILPTIDMRMAALEKRVGELERRLT